MKNQLPSGESNARHPFDDVSRLHADKPDICPSVEEITRFVSKQATKSNRGKMLKHFNHCAACRHHWLQTASFLGQIEPEKKPAKSFFWKPRLVSWQVGLPVAAALLLAVTIPVISPYNISGNIDHSFLALGEKIETANLIHDLVTPSNSVIAFNGMPPTSTKKAFAAGVLDAKTQFAITAGNSEILTGDIKTSSSDSNLEDYYQFGRWTVVLWISARSEYSGNEWARHLKILQALRSRLKDSQDLQFDTNLAVDFLNSLEPLLVDLEDKSNPLVYSDLLRKIEITLETLAS